MFVYKCLQDRVVEVPYEKVVYQDKVDVQYVDVERIVEHIVRKEVQGLFFFFGDKIPQLWLNCKSLMKTCTTAKCWISMSTFLSFCQSTDLLIFRASRFRARG